MFQHQILSKNVSESSKPLHIKVNSSSISALGDFTPLSHHGVHIHHCQKTTKRFAFMCGIKSFRPYPLPHPTSYIYSVLKKSFNLRHVAASNICLFSDVSVFEPQEEKDSILASSYVNKDRRSLLVFIYIALCNMVDKKYEASAKTPTFNYVFIFGEAHIYK